MKTINISTLKARASEIVRGVRKGASIIIMNRDVPVAEIIPYQNKPALAIREPEKKFHVPAGSITAPVDPLVYLLEDRGKK